jgi:hypothetical protein
LGRDGKYRAMLIPDTLAGIDEHAQFASHARCCIYLRILAKECDRSRCPELGWMGVDIIQ